jgi:dTDP-glucose 4,6-dehydratase
VAKPQFNQSKAIGDVLANVTTLLESSGLGLPRAVVNFPGDVYHLATDKNQTLREVVEEICRQMGARFDDCVATTPPRLAQDPAYLLDCTKAKKEFGWRPKLTVADVIGETIDWMRRNLDRLKKIPADYVHKP